MPQNCHERKNKHHRETVIEVSHEELDRLPFDLRAQHLLCFEHLTRTGAERAMITIGTGLEKNVSLPPSSMSTIPSDRSFVMSSGISRNWA